jgi:hypothetical protein
MKLKSLSYGLILAIFSCSLGYAAVQPKVQPPKKQTGTDWLLMGPMEKVECVNATVAFLIKKGIPISQTPHIYGALLNSVVDQPGADKADIVNLVTTLVYKNEPQTRPIINQMRNKPDKITLDPVKKSSSKKTKIA